MTKYPFETLIEAQSMQRLYWESYADFKSYVERLASGNQWDRSKVPV